MRTRDKSRSRAGLPRNVRDYNTAIQTVPTNILAGMFGFTVEQYFEMTDPAQREAPKVSFS